MRNKLRIGFLLSTSLLSESSFASASHLNAVKATLNSIDKAVRSSIIRAEELFEQNKGNRMRADVKLINGSGNINPFLSDLRILSSANYAVGLTFAGGSGAFVYNSASPNTSVPVAKSLYGVHIQFIPIFNPGDAVINSWECITDADKYAVVFIGDNATATQGNISFISTNTNPGDNPYLSACVFINDASYSGSITTTTDTTGSGTTSGSSSGSGSSSDSNNNGNGNGNGNGNNGWHAGWWDNNGWHDGWWDDDKH